MRILLYIALAITVIGILATIVMTVVSFQGWIKEIKRHKEWEKKLP
jgi:heme exporter protein D